MKSERPTLSAKLLCITLLFIAVPHSFAIIRSPYPAKSQPPDRGQVIVIGDKFSAAAKNGR
jgi:hypothetical protein